MVSSSAAARSNMILGVVLVAVLDPGAILAADLLAARRFPSA